MASPKTLPPRIFSIWLSSSVPRVHNWIPEVSTPRELQINLYSLDASGPHHERGFYTNEDGLKEAFEIFDEYKYPLVGFNLFNHAWRVIAKHTDVSAAIPLTCDVYQAAVDLSSALDRFDDVSHKRDDLMTANFEQFSPATMPDKGQQAVALWYLMVTQRSLQLGPNLVTLSRGIFNNLVLAKPRFADAGEWAQSILETGTTFEKKMRSFDRVRGSLLEPIYDPYVQTARS